MPIAVLRDSPTDIRSTPVIRLDFRQGKGALRDVSLGVSTARILVSSHLITGYNRPLRSLSSFETVSVALASNHSSCWT
jgi:hypothetical protein